MLHARRPILFAAALVTAAMTIAALGGPLDPPPGQITSTYTTLHEIEPRINVNTLAGDTKSVHLITKPGSYYLTASPALAAGKDAIVIVASPVMLDLNGFTVSGLDTGILIAASQGDISIRNGSVRGCTNEGILAPAGTAVVRLESLQISGNGKSGVKVNTAMMEGCTLVGNGGSGIFASAGSVIRGCSAIGNTLDGIAVQDSCVVENCSSTANLASGISANYKCTVRGNTASRNAQIGIDATTGCLVESNVANNNAASQIRIYARCRLVGNSAVTPASGGPACIWSLSDDNTIENNSLSTDSPTTQGIGLLVDGEHSFIGSNRVSKRFANPYDLDLKNSWGPLVDAYQSGDISARPGGANPSANLVH